MGEGKAHVETRAPGELEHEVEEIRDDMTEVVGELDRRRHEFFDWRLQLRRNARGLAIVAFGSLLLVGAAVGLATWRARRRARPLYRARQYRGALERMWRHPELIARPNPSAGKKAVAAALSSAAGAAAKALTNRAMSPRPSTL